MEGDTAVNEWVFHVADWGQRTSLMCTVTAGAAAHTKRHSYPQWHVNLCNLRSRCKVPFSSPQRIPSRTAVRFLSVVWMKVTVTLNHFLCSFFLLICQSLQAPDVAVIIVKRYGWVILSTLTYSLWFMTPRLLKHWFSVQSWKTSRLSLQTRRHTLVTESGYQGNETHPQAYTCLPCPL